MIELLNIDCMEYMATCTDKQFDLAIVDPPYGIGMDGSNHPKGIASCFDHRSGHSNNIKRNNYEGKEWDNNRPNQSYFNELMRISKNQIIWGGNYFADFLSPQSCWIVWDKCNVGTHQSDCELAWTSFNTAIRKYAFMWSGAWQGNPAKGEKMQGNKKLNEKRIHPTQKPVQLYRWILNNYAIPYMKIIDTHLGSGSSAIAAYDFGCDFVGCEIDKDYYDAAVKRFEIHKMQQKLF